ncbi:hypothetical protein TNCT_33361 [Trichonephila clavata]|uniref:Uncharacterized protein n=1 Tax=Trichonephila clavata TaxID=2740835 RepID=A0A8X6HGI5_TRICU|nr:hypothetical protein TNCT_33361 [Trichonephila clavata]
MSSVLMRDFSALTFFRRGDAGEHQSVLCHFVSRSYLRHQDSSSVATQLKKYGVTCAVPTKSSVNPLNVPSSDRQSGDMAQDDNTLCSSL